MRLPRLILNPAIRPWIFLWQRERRENSRLRRELTEWQSKFLQKMNVSPLFSSPPKPVEPTVRPPIGPLGKREWLAKNAGPNHVPSAEEILEQAARVKGR